MAAQTGDFSGALACLRTPGQGVKAGFQSERRETWACLTRNTALLVGLPFSQGALEP